MIGKKNYRNARWCSFQRIAVAIFLLKPQMAVGSKFDCNFITIFQTRKRRPTEVKRLAMVTQLVTGKVKTRIQLSFPLCYMPASNCGGRRLLDAFQGVGVLGARVQG